MPAGQGSRLGHPQHTSNTCLATNTTAPHLNKHNAWEAGLAPATQPQLAPPLHYALALFQTLYMMEPNAATAQHQLPPLLPAVAAAAALPARPCCPCCATATWRLLPCMLPLRCFFRLLCCGQLLCCLCQTVRH